MCYITILHIHIAIQRKTVGAPTRIWGSEPGARCCSVKNWAPQHLDGPQAK